MEYTSNDICMPKENNYKKKLFKKNPNFTVLDRSQRDRDVVFSLIHDRVERDKPCCEKERKKNSSGEKERV